MLLHRLTDTGLLNSLREVESVRQRLNNLLAVESSDGLSGPTFPLLSTWISEEGAVVTAELPGMDTADLELHIVHDSLTIKGERKIEQLREGETFHRRERGAGAFSRTMQLPFKINAETVEAKFSKGILEVKLPRAESEKPKKIAIRAH